MKNTFFGKLLSSGLQAIAVQVLGGVFFLVIAAYLSKEEMGFINWANAVSVVLTMILSFGMDQVVVRRIAASESSDWASAAYLFHSFLGSCVTFVILFAFKTLSNDHNYKIEILPWLFAAQALLFSAGPLKQLLNAKQKFAPYGVIAIISNIIKLLAVYLFISANSLSIQAVLGILIGCAAFEFACVLFYVIAKGYFTFYFKKVAYFKLLKEAFPQYIAILFDSCLAYADRILLLLLSTAIASGDYGFAYRAYEIAKLPVVIISPIILARFAKIFIGNSKLSDEGKKQVQGLFTVEMFFACGIPLLLNMLWSPLLDHFYHGKYGSANSSEFMILSLCLPFQFYINILWTLGFAAKRYKETTRIIATTAVINVVLNLIFIPLYGGNGAAVAFLLTSVIQLLMYYHNVKKHIMEFSSKAFVVFFTISIAAYFAAISVTNVILMQLLIAVVIYLAVSLLSKQLQRKHLDILFSFLKK